MNKLIVDTNKDEWNVIHPALLAIQAGKKIRSWKVTHQFEDDHLPCVTIKLIIGSTTYKVDECWLSTKGLKDCIFAELDKKSREHVIKRWNRMAREALKENKRWKEEEENKVK